MKALQLFLVLIFCCQTVFANNEPQKSDLEMIIRVMAEQYAKSAAQDIAVQELIKQASKVVGEQIAAQMADTTMGVLAVIGIVQNVQAYESATTEGGKYSAAAHAVAAAISYAFSAVPVVGLAVNLGVAGQDLMAAYISKDFILEQAKTRTEIARIYKETSEIRVAQYNAEVKAMEVLSSRVVAVNFLAEAYKKAHEGKCEKDEFDFKTPAACFYSISNLREIIGKQVQTLGLVLNFNGRFLKHNMDDNRFKMLLETFKNSEAQYKKLSSSMNSSIKQVVFGQIWDITNQFNQDFASRRCETSLLVNLKRLFTAKKNLLKSQDQDIWQQSRVSEIKIELENLVTGLCSEYLKTAPSDIKKLTELALASSLGS